MIKAETKILPFAQAPHRGSKGPLSCATRRVAAYFNLALFLLGAALGADFIKKWRIQIHDHPL